MHYGLWTWLCSGYISPTLRPSLQFNVEINMHKSNMIKTHPLHKFWNWQPVHGSLHVAKRHTLPEERQLICMYIYILTTNSCTKFLVVTLLNKLPHYHTPALSNPGYWSLHLCFLSPSQVMKRQFVATAFQKSACHIGTQFTSSIHDETYTHDAKHNQLCSTLLPLLRMPVM